MIATLLYNLPMERKEKSQEPINWERMELVNEDLARLAERFRELDLLITTSQIQDDGELSISLFEAAVRALYSSFLDSQNEKFVTEKTNSFLRVLERYFGEKNLLGEGWYKLREKDITHWFAGQLRGFLMYISTATRGKQELQNYYSHNDYIADFAKLEKDFGQFVTPTFRRLEQKEPSKALMDSLNQIAGQFGGVAESISLLTGRVYRSNSQVVVYIRDARQYIPETHERTEDVVAQQLLPLLGDLWWKPDSWDSLIDYEFHCWLDGVLHQVWIKDFSYLNEHHKAMQTLATQPELREELDRQLRSNILSYDYNDYLVLPVHRLSH